MPTEHLMGSGALYIRLERDILYLRIMIFRKEGLCFCGDILCGN